MCIRDSGKTIAQKFTTASGLSDHRLLNLQLDIKTAPNDPDGVTVKIKSVADDGTPGEDVYTLTNPSNLSSDGIRTFTAPSDATLEPSTDYFVYILKTLAPTLPPLLRYQLPTTKTALDQMVGVLLISGITKQTTLGQPAPNL